MIGIENDKICQVLHGTMYLDRDEYNLCRLAMQLIIALRFYVT